MENNIQPQTEPITVNDLIAIRAIIDLAAQRGAFKGPELQEVGTIFNKLSAFVDAAVAALEQQSETTENTTQQGE